MTLSEKIQHYRKSAGLSQEELAKSLLVSRQTISLWENGQTLPTIDNLIRLREIFGISLDEMLCSETVDTATKQSDPFCESYICDNNTEGSAKVKSAILTPALITISSLLILLSSIIAYGIYNRHSSHILDIFLILFSAIALTAIILYSLYMLYSLKDLQKDSSSLTELRIGEDTLAIEFKRGEGEALVSKASHTDASISAVGKKHVRIVCKNTSAYLKKESIPPSSKLWHFKSRKFSGKHLMLTVLTLTLLILAFGIADLILSAPLKRIERYSDIDIPKYSGISENDTKGLIGGIYIEYSADIFLDSMTASELEAAMDGSIKWKTYSESDTSTSVVPSVISYSGAEYFFHREYNSRKHVFLFYFEDENMMRVILLRNDT